MLKKQTFKLTEVAKINCITSNELKEILIKKDVIYMDRKIYMSGKIINQLAVNPRIENAAFTNEKKKYQEVIFNTWVIDNIINDRIEKEKIDKKYIEDNVFNLYNVRVLKSFEKYILNEKNDFKRIKKIIVLCNKFYNESFYADLVYGYNTYYIQKYFSNDVCNKFYEYARNSLKTFVSSKFYKNDGNIKKCKPAGRLYTGNRSEFTTLPGKFISKLTEVQTTQLLNALGYNKTIDKDLSDIFCSNYTIKISNIKLKNLCREYGQYYQHWIKFKTLGQMNWYISKSGRASSIFHTAPSDFLSKILVSKDGSSKIVKLDVKTCGVNIMENYLDVKVKSDDIYQEMADLDRRRSRDYFKEIFISQGYGKRSKYIRLFHNRYYIALNKFADELLVNHQVSIQSFVQFMESELVIKICRRYNILSKHDCWYFTKDQVHLIEQVKKDYNEFKKYPARFTLEKI